MDALVSTVDVLKTSQAVGNVTTTEKEKLEKIAKDFESVFMAQMLKPMWEGVDTDGLFGGGPGEDVMKDLLVQEYGKSMVRNDQHGLSPAIMDAMIRMQEAANAHIS
ncbi:MAG: rod-binding protein [Alphaproteobacteria bacterium]|nr:rod-binding protein [Alphaproteobacteria bacterium]